MATKPLPGWPAMLRRRAAADYCSLSVAERRLNADGGMFAEVKAA